MIFGKILIFFATIVLLGAPLSAQAKTNADCPKRILKAQELAEPNPDEYAGLTASEKLEAVVQDLHQSLSKVATLATDPWIDVPHVSLTHSRPGPRGGVQTLLHRNGSWFSTRNFPFNNAHGDPTWMYSTFGEKTSNLLGYEMASPEEIWVPNAKELNHSVEALNKDLVRAKKEPIPVQFYAQDPNSPIVEGRIYLAHTQKGEWPIADSDEMIHDHAFHIPILLTENLISKIGALTESSLLFSKFLEQKSAQPAFNWIRESHIADWVVHERTMELDGNALLIPPLQYSLLKRSAGKASADTASFKRTMKLAYRELLDNGRSPQEHLIEIAKRVQDPKRQDNGFAPPPPTLTPKQSEALLRLTAEFNQIHEKDPLFAQPVSLGTYSNSERFTAEYFDNEVAELIKILRNRFVDITSL